MLTSQPLERKTRIFSVWIKEPITKAVSTVEIKAFTQFDAVVRVYSSQVDKHVDFQKYSFDDGETLVLVHAQKNKKVKKRIDELFFHTQHLAVFQQTPESILRRKLERLLKLEEPTRTSIWKSVVCAGCGGVIPAKDYEILQVRGGHFLCDYSCFALKMAKDNGH
ncbi:hypothetical protein MKX41_30650 [Paenibacillus sp. FSL R5-0475]|uniref:hypothetical protein n=1 Tax=Paenibacillus sp. FSL R5-0475 TaxID=2921643 RepID=UPI0030FD1251